MEELSTRWLRVKKSKPNGDSGRKTAMTPGTDRQTYVGWHPGRRI